VCAGNACKHMHAQHDCGYWYASLCIRLLMQKKVHAVYLTAVGICSKQMQQLLLLRPHAPGCCTASSMPAAAAAAALVLCKVALRSQQSLACAHLAHKRFVPNVVDAGGARAAACP
jgi:hypothetical protein